MQNMTLNDKVKISDKIVYQKVEDETVLLDLENGSYYGLNSVGSRIWELLSEKQEIQSVFDSMIKDYEVKPEKLQQDILSLLHKLRTKGLIEVTG